jgi:hypothetical protein
MRKVIKGTLKDLSGIPVHFFQTIRDQLLFPSGPETYEDYLRSKIKDQYGLIRLKEDSISYLQGQMLGCDHTLRDREQLLTQKDKELQDLRQKIRSLEWQLREERVRNTRRR